MIPPSTAGSSNRPPGSAMRGMNAPPPSTAYKRLGTATGKNVVPGTATGTPVLVENRPITQHGVVGIRTAVGGGGRRVLDKNYFISELRQKRIEIEKVTQKMKGDLETLQKRQAQHNSMDKRAQDLGKEVKLLQEALADYNTVLDKVGSQTPTSAITQEHAALRDRNDSLNARIEEVVSARLTVEQKARQAEQRFQEIQRTMTARMESMPPSQRQQYNGLVSEQEELAKDCRRQEEEMDALDRQLAVQEGELGRNPLKQRSLQLQELIRQLTEKKYELQKEEERNKQPPDEQRTALMTRIKRDNADVEKATGEMKALQDVIKKTEARVAQLTGNSPQVNAAEEAAKREKFQELVVKERDLSNFMDSFPSRRAAKMEEQGGKEDAIVGLLDKIQKLMAIAAGALPTSNKFREMQDELQYKQMQLENTQVTQERLKEELLMRRTELDKIDVLEDKIKSELEQLAARMEELRSQTQELANTGDMSAKADAARERLERQQQQLQQRRGFLQQIVTDKFFKYKAREEQLRDSDRHVALQKMDGTLRQMHTQIFKDAEFVRAKESETNYKHLALHVTQLTEELNTLLKRALA